MARHFLHSILLVIEAIAALALIGLGIWGKYRQAMHRVEERVDKAGVQTLFKGDQ